MQVQLQISFFLWTPQSRGPMRFSFQYRYLEGTVHNSIPLPLSAALVCLTLFGSYFLLNWDRDILAIECSLARVPRSQFCGRWNSKSGTWDWDTRPIAKFCELWTQYPGCFDVTWAHQRRHTYVVTHHQHVMYYITSWISLLKQFPFVLLTLFSRSYPFSQQYHYFL